MPDLWVLRFLPSDGLLFPNAIGEECDWGRVDEQPLFSYVKIGFGLALRARLGYLGSMQVHYFPTRLGLGQYDRPSIEKSGPVIQVERRNPTSPSI